eukprot:8981760-Pyramimonas_sp.AAC.1
MAMASGHLGIELFNTSSVTVSLQLLGQETGIGVLADPRKGREGPGRPEEGRSRREGGSAEEEEHSPGRGGGRRKDEQETGGLKSC